MIRADTDYEYLAYNSATRSISMCILCKAMHSVEKIQGHGAKANVVSISLPLSDAHDQRDAKWMKRIAVSRLWEQDCGSAVGVIIRLSQVTDHNIHEGTDMMWQKLIKTTVTEFLHWGAKSQKDRAAFAAAKPVQMKEKDRVQSTKLTQRVKCMQTALPFLAVPVPFACM